MKTEVRSKDEIAEELDYDRMETTRALSQAKKALFRTKDQIAEEIDASREHLRDSFFATRDKVIHRNPAVLAFKAARGVFETARTKASFSAQKTDYRIRSNLYASLGIAAAAGLLVGYLKTSRKAKHQIGCC